MLKYAPPRLLHHKLDGFRIPLIIPLHLCQKTDTGPERIHLHFKLYFFVAGVFGLFSPAFHTHGITADNIFQALQFFFRAPQFLRACACFIFQRCVLFSCRHGVLRQRVFPVVQLLRR